VSRQNLQNCDLKTHATPRQHRDPNISEPKTGKIWVHLQSKIKMTLPIFPVSAKLATRVAICKRATVRLLDTAFSTLFGRSCGYPLGKAEALFERSQG
jgi:hypothetical protein